MSGETEISGPEPLQVARTEGRGILLDLFGEPLFGCQLVRLDSLQLRDQLLGRLGFQVGFPHHGGHAR